MDGRSCATFPRRAGATLGLGADLDGWAKNPTAKPNGYADGADVPKFAPASHVNNLAVGFP